MSKTPTIAETKSENRAKANLRVHGHVVAQELLADELLVALGARVDGAAVDAHVLGEHVLVEEGLLADGAHVVALQLRRRQRHARRALARVPVARLLVQVQAQLRRETLLAESACMDNNSFCVNYTYLRWAR